MPPVGFDFHDVDPAVPGAEIAGACFRLFAGHAISFVNKWTAWRTVFKKPFLAFVVSFTDNDPEFVRNQLAPPISKLSIC